jgi:hypothetical protein
MKRLNEGKSVRKALPNGILGNKRMLGANVAGQQSIGEVQQAINAFRMSLIEYAGRMINVRALHIFIELNHHFTKVTHHLSINVK